MESRIDEVYEPKRRTDYSRAAKVSRFIVRYSPIIVFLYSLVFYWLVSTGFGWNTPRAKMDTLDAKVDRNNRNTTMSLDSLTLRADKTDATNQRVLDILEVFSLDLCLRRKYDPFVYRKLRCAELLRGT